MEDAKEGAYSYTVTSVPRRLYTDPISTPMIPPPIIAIDLGIAGKESASVDVIICFPSRVIKGRFAGSEPVAMITFSAPYWVDVFP